MATWPIDDNYTGFSKTVIKLANRQVSSAGYQMSTGRGTVKKYRFNVEISYLTETQTGTISTFFDTNQGTSFTLNDPNPNSSATYEVEFDQDEIEFKYVDVNQQEAAGDKGQYSTSISFVEV